MRLLKFLFPTFLMAFLKRIYVANKFNVHLGRGTSVSATTFFEGRSVINRGCDLSGSFIGMGTYIAGNSRLTNARIGRFCSIGKNVQAGFGLHPSKIFVSTHPCFFSLQKQAGFTFVEQQLFEEHKYVSDSNNIKYQVHIGNDVWIGNDVSIIDGVTVGDGAIIGLGSIVTKDVEPYSINVGIPAKKLGYRFSCEQIDFLLQFRWWEKDFDWVKTNADVFSNIDEFINRTNPSKDKLV